MANFTPLGSNLKWKSGEISSSNAQPLENFVGKKWIWFLKNLFLNLDTNGEIIIKASVSGSCRKCGYTGHLPYQCRNFIQIKPSQPVQIDISSTSSEEYETPLTSKKG